MSHRHFHWCSLCYEEPSSPGCEVELLSFRVPEDLHSFTPLFNMRADRDDCLVPTHFLHFPPVKHCFHFLLLFLVFVSPDRQYQSSKIIIRWMKTIFFLEGYEDRREDVPSWPHLGTRCVVSILIFVAFPSATRFHKLTPLPNAFAFPPFLFLFG